MTNASFHSNLSKPLADKVQAALADWTAGKKCDRLWAKDAGLWTASGEEKWLGWLDSVEQQLAGIAALRNLSEGPRDFSNILVFGMGGSSLGPEVLGKTFHAPLHTLDSTDPAQIRAVEAAHDPATTLYVVSSKSGGTLETRILGQYFLAQAKKKLGDKAGAHFIAVTDPGSALEKTAKAEGFRHVFLGEPSIGGRYSVLSPFGMVPAAAAGIAVEKVLQSVGSPGTELEFAL